MYLLILEISRRLKCFYQCFRLLVPRMDIAIKWNRFAGYASHRYPHYKLCGETYAVRKPSYGGSLNPPLGARTSNTAEIDATKRNIVASARCLPGQRLYLRNRYKHIGVLSEILSVKRIPLSKSEGVIETPGHVFADVAMRIKKPRRIEYLRGGIYILIII